MIAMTGRAAARFVLPFWSGYRLCWLLLATLWLSQAHAGPEERDVQLEAQLDQLVGLGRYPTDLTALQQVAAQAGQSTAFETYIRAEGNLLLWQGLEQKQPEPALQKARDLYQQAQQRGSDNAMAELLAAQCEILLQQGKAAEYMQLLPDLERHLAKTDNPRLHFHINLLISKLWQAAAQQELTLKYALAAQQAATDIQDQFRLQRRTQLNMHIARTQAALQQYQEAFDLLNSSVEEMLQQPKAQPELAELYLLMGFMQQHQHGPTDAAITYFSQAVEWARKTNNARTVLLGLNNIGANLLLQQKYPQAEQYLQQAQQVVTRDPLVIERLVIDFNLGYLAVLQGRYADGILVMVKAAEAFRKVARPDQVAHLMTHLADAYGRMGQYQQQSAVLAEKLQLLSSFYSDERARVINEMQIRYQSNDRALQVELLNQRLALQQQQYQNQKRLSWMAFGLGVAALTVLVVLVLSNRKIRHINNLLSEKNDQLHQLSLRDPLTGLKNRRAIELPAAGGPPSDSERRQPQAGALLVLLDIDRFKNINDTYGHAVGDEVLLAVASRLKQFCRAEDQILRWGGEEFLLLLNGIGAEEASTTVRRLVQLLSTSPVETGAGALAVSASGGFLLVGSVTPQDAQLWDWQLKFTDLLLYRSKAQGRNRLFGWLAPVTAQGRQEVDTQLAQADTELVEVLGPA